MPPTRRAVLAALAAGSGASDGDETAVRALAHALDAREATVARHLDALVACDLARRTADGVRVTVTGEEFLALGVDGGVVETPPDDRAERWTFIRPRVERESDERRGRTRRARPRDERVRRARVPGL